VVALSAKEGPQPKLHPLRREKRGFGGGASDGSKSTSGGGGSSSSLAAPVGGGRAGVSRVGVPLKPNNAGDVHAGNTIKSMPLDQAQSMGHFPQLAVPEDLTRVTNTEEVEALVLKAIERHGGDLIAGLRDKGWWSSDDAVLPDKMLRFLRCEVEALWHTNKFDVSQKVVGNMYFDKENVYATEIDGSKYDAAKGLVHYTVTATKLLTELVTKNFPELDLSPRFIGNKLNLCTGNGAKFDVHLDTGVAEKPFNRKLTLLIYLNDWRPELGGRLMLEGEVGQIDAAKEKAGLPVSIAPKSGRWVAFWSDRMLHGVEPSYAPAGLTDFRASYTIWMCTEEGARVGPPAVAAEAFTPKVTTIASVPNQAPADSRSSGRGGYERPPSFGTF